jgi:nitrate/TMAO reductase-like tetraheme cytochrome c subunit
VAGPPSAKGGNLLKKTVSVLAAVCVVALAAGLAWSAPSYVGNDKCRPCHMKDQTYPTWAETKHAKAIESLKPEERTKAECLKCHATNADAATPGVGCESCHGAGSEYRNIQIMRDRAKAVAAGMIVPDEKTCLQCHSGAPHDLPKWNFAEAMKTGVHALGGGK